VNYTKTPLDQPTKVNYAKTSLDRQKWITQKHHFTDKPTYRI